MRAAIGDTLHIHTNHVGEAEALGEILEVRGTDGAPPYLVQFRDGRTRLLYPGADAVVEAPAPAGAPAVSSSSSSGSAGSSGSGSGSGSGSNGGNGTVGSGGNGTANAGTNGNNSRPPRSARRIHTRPGW